ncbi:hypothetical protein AAIJ07_34480, partial [Pseudomonas aeruginosa]|uniref:hypothetical protein n=1 Tax=Pseudomonas aeruginosa TaxID=287 RepID=UPI0031B694C2
EHHRRPASSFSRAWSTVLFMSFKQVASSSACPVENAPKAAVIALRRPDSSARMRARISASVGAAAAGAAGAAGAGVGAGVLAGAS